MQCLHRQPAAAQLADCRVIEGWRRYQRPRVPSKALPPTRAHPDDKNSQQLDQLLAGLAELRQQQLLHPEDDDEDEWEAEEFPPEAEGVEWVWWRADGFSPQGQAAQDPVGSSPSSSSSDAQVATAAAVEQRSANALQQQLLLDVQQALEPSVPAQDGLQRQPLLQQGQQQGQPQPQPPSRGGQQAARQQQQQQQQQHSMEMQGQPDSQAAVRQPRSSGRTRRSRRQQPQQDP